MTKKYTYCGSGCVMWRKNDDKKNIDGNDTVDTAEITITVVSYIDMHASKIREGVRRIGRVRYSRVG